MDKKHITVAEAGRLGGRKTASTHGREFYEEIGRKGGEKVSEEHGPSSIEKSAVKVAVSAPNSMKAQKKPRAKSA